MSENGFTPGPWFVDGPDNSQGYETWRVHALDNAIEATICELWSGEHNNQATARLIAAAPELLEGCDNMNETVRRVQDVLARHLDPSYGPSDDHETINAVLDIVDHKDTLAKQRKSIAALSKAKAGDPQ